MNRQIEINDVTVLGAGTMGHGIAQVCAMADMRVRLFDTDRKRLDEGLDRVRENLDKGVARGKVSADDRSRALSRLDGGTALTDVCEDADLVIEAIPENLELKQTVFRDIDGVLRDDAIRATNTSSLSVSRIADATDRPDRMVGLHFFNPVHIMALLEIVRGERTSDETLATAVDFTRRIGKEPIVVTDTPGFASSRLGVVLGLEAMRMVEQEVASPQDIDRAMELGYRHPMGPLRLTDLVGLDVRLGIAEYLHAELGGEQYAPPEILRRMVADGRLGKKSGRGFYDWTER